MPRRVVSASFVVSAVGPRDYPTDGLPEIAMIGRSNVGKSTLINALVHRDVARTSATPGKTRLVNVYRITRDGRPAFYLIDLPGYGHASGGEEAREEFAGLTGQYFASRLARAAAGAPARPGKAWTSPAAPTRAGTQGAPLVGAVLAIDARHVGMASDVEACRWLQAHELPFVVVATKADKLSQSERARLPRECERSLGQTPLPVSALKGEGLDDLWKRLAGWTA